MEHDTANGEKNENAVSPEEVRLKQELDKARGAYAMVYRRVEAGATGISPVRLTEAREKQIRKDEPLGELAQAWNAYDNALKAYLIEIRQTRGELAERRACAHEAEELIRDKRRLRFMVAFGKWLGEKEWFKSAMSGVMHGVEWLKTHKTEALKIAALTAFLLTLGGAALVAALPVAVLQAAVPFLAYGGSVAAGVSVAVPLGIALRMWLESIDKRHEEKLLKAGKMTPEEIGQEMADRRRSVKFFSFLIALITGFGVRYGVRDAVLSTDWVGVQKGINDATNLEAQAAEPRGPRPGAPGEVTPEEQSVIDNTLRPYEQQLPRLRGQIAELEAQREDHIRRMMAQGQPRAMAEFNFDNNIEQLKYSLRRCENMIRGAREQMALVAERPFNPRFPNILAEEGRFSIERINRAFAYFDGHRKVIAEFVRTGRVPNVQAVELSVLDGEGGRGRAMVLGQESPDGVSDEMRAIYEQQPTNLREYLVDKVFDVY
ncbi:MAG: hypothetical protein RLZZ283_63, partial [Candidatus Parcubacteria bacterium]